MYLMRIGENGAEKPVARVNDGTYISQFLVLKPGNLISTGTPPGVGIGLKPPIWSPPGDIMELGIAGLGNQRQRVVGPW